MVGANIFNKPSENSKLPLTAASATAHLRHQRRQKSDTITWREHKQVVVKVVERKALGFKRAGGEANNCQALGRQ